MGCHNRDFLKSSIDGKVVVITGANTGIGLETVKELNLRGGKIYMLCRNEAKANEAINTLVQDGCHGERLIFVPCDLSNMKSINDCADKIEKAEDHVNILINNAGIMYYPKYEKTVDGHEMTWQSNHLGPFLLTERLLPLVKKSKEGRIINVSALLHKASDKINLQTIDNEEEFGRLMSYNRSKLANIMHARALAARLTRDGVTNVTVNSLHPGVVDTELVKLPIIIKQIGGPFKSLFFKSRREGAMTTLYLALDEKVKDTTGKYFSDCKMVPESDDARNDEACEELFKYSLKQCHLPVQ